MPSYGFVLCILLASIGACSASEPPGVARESLIQADPRAEDRAARRAALGVDGPRTVPTGALNAAEKMRVLNDPLHAQTRAAAAARDAEIQRGMASRLSLAANEEKAFLAVMSEAHAAKLQIIEFHKQNRNLERGEFRRRLAAELPAAVKSASAASIHSKLKGALGEERYTRYLELLDADGES